MNRTLRVGRLVWLLSLPVICVLLLGCPGPQEKTKTGVPDKSVKPSESPAPTPKQPSATKPSTPEQPKTKTPIPGPEAKPKLPVPTPEPEAKLPVPTPEPGEKLPVPPPETEEKLPVPSPEEKTPPPEPEAKMPAPTPEPGGKLPVPTPEPENKLPVPTPEPEEKTPAPTPEPENKLPVPTPEPEEKTPGQSSTADPDTATAMAPIPIELPPPNFRGTPVPLEEPNVEKPTGKPRAPFLAPVGTVNLALGKPVTASDPQPVAGEVDYVTDGDKRASDFGYLELRPGSEWVQIDLGQKSAIYAVLLWHNHAEARVYRDVVIQVSDDPDFLNAVTVFNNDYDNSSGLGIGRQMGYVETSEGKLIDTKGVEGRYVRLYSKGNHIDAKNHYTEVEVFGKPAA